MKKFKQYFQDKITLPQTEQQWVDWHDANEHLYHLVEPQPRVVAERIDAVVEQLYKISTKARSYMVTGSNTYHIFQVRGRFISIQQPTGNLLATDEDDGKYHMRNGGGFREVRRK